MGVNSDKAGFTLRTLGELSLQDASGHAVKLRTRKGLLLLAFLATEPDRSWSREHLAAVFWGDRMDRQARNSLRSALSDIRSAVGDAAVLVDGGTLTVNPAVVASDAGYLRQLDQIGGDGGTEDFRTFYGGEFLEEFDGPEDAMDWVMSVRTECRDHAANVLKRRLHAHSGRGDIETAIRSARELLSLDPYSEDSHRTLMRLYASNGQRSKAIAQFQNCRQMMQHELGVEPSPETKALADQIALRDSVAITDMHQPGGRRRTYSPAAACADRCGHAGRPAIDRRNALCQHERRCRAGLFCGRHCRRHRDRPVACAQPVGRGQQFRSRAEGTRKPPGSGGPRPVGPVRFGRQRPEIRTEYPDHDPPDRRADEPPDMGRALRPRTGEDFRPAKRDFLQRRGRAGIALFACCGLRGRCPWHAEYRSARVLSARTGLSEGNDPAER